MDFSSVALFLVAALAIAVSPGPGIFYVAARTLAGGRDEGLASSLGTGLGGLVHVAAGAVGVSALVLASAEAFALLKVAGAIYLIWLGWKLLRANAGFGEIGKTPAPRGGFFLQGFLVLMSNPKALLWFGAFIPQFVDASGNYVGQIVLLGLTAMATAAITDGAYAVLGGRTGQFMSAKRIRLASQLSGLFLIGGGVWLAFTRAR